MSRIYNLGCLLRPSFFFAPLIQADRQLSGDLIGEREMFSLQDFDNLVLI
jgi:hypothetical protein